MRIRFPSIDEALDRAREAVRRFPFVILSGLVAALCACIATGSGAEDHWIRATMAALLGLPLYVTVSLVLERVRATSSTRWVAGLAAGAVPAGFFLLSTGWSDTLLWTRLLHLELLLHLSVAVVPFLGRPADRGFWQFNRILFLRFLTGALFTGVLFAGLALALAALDPLFGIGVEGDVYAWLLFGLAFFVSPWYFVAGVPADLTALEAVDTYPTGLRVFAQFILLPLVVVYLTLLTLYFGRVLITRTWPSGWIGWLVSGVAVAGTLALLLVHPLRTRGGRWVDVYNRWFYVALFPSIGMLLAAIYQRVAQYGFTERRYFLLALALVLTGIAVYYAITASRNIRVIPTGLLAATLLALFGPWSAYAVAEHSQRGRIIDVLERNDMLVDGRAVPATGDVSREDRAQMSGALRYLLRTHGVRSVVPLLVGEPPPDDSLRIARWQADTRAAAIMESLNVRFLDRLDTRGDVIFVRAEPAGAMLDVRGWDRLLEGELTQPLVGRTGADSVRLRPSPAGLLSFHVWENDTAVLLVDVSEPLRRILERHDDAVGGVNLPPDSLTFDAVSSSARARVLLQHFSVLRTDSGYVVQNAQGKVLLGFVGSAR